MRIVFDTNVFISAIFWKGKPIEIILTAIERKWEIFISEDILNEFERVLRRDFPIVEDKVREAVLTLRSMSKVIQPSETIQIITEDPSDNRILECAAECHADYIVTGDSHLLKLGEYRGTCILSPGQLLSEITR